MSPVSVIPRDGSAVSPSDVALAAIPQGARIGYMVAALLGTAVTTSLFTYRVRTISKAFNFGRLKPLHYMQLAVYVLGIFFSASAAITTFGVGLTGPVECRAAIILCLVFYLGQKFLLYLFLVERMQVIRARQTPRYRNWVYLAGLVVVIAGFSAVVAISFMWMVSEYDAGTGECFIGLPARVALPLLTYDISINLLLTGVFLHYVKPYLQGGLVAFFFDRKPRQPPLPGANSTEDNGGAGAISLPQVKLKRIIRKTFWGCILIMPSTIANMTVLAIMKGHQAGWMCLTFCTLDVLWCIIVIHWLTAPEDDDSPSVSGPSAQGAVAVPVTASRSRVRSYHHHPHHSAIASYSKPRSSSQTEMDPLGIRREIRITQTVDFPDDESPSRKDSTSISTHEVGLSDD